MRGVTDYHADKQGRIWSYKTAHPPHVRKVPRLLIGGLTTKGYRHVVLRVGDDFRCLQVHQLVLLTYRGSKPSPRHQTRHLNGNPSDNRLSNLAWGTPEENYLDTVRHGRTVCYRGENHWKAKTTEVAVRKMRRLRATSGLSAAKIAPLFGLSRSNVDYILRRRTWKHVA